MHFEKNRFEIWNPLQHPYKHTLSDFAYSHNAVPWVTTLEGVINAILAVNYPNTEASVATPADLPTGIDTPNIGDVVPTLLDYRVVIDDGDGKGSGYRWEHREGEAAPSWHKIYDMDWGEETIVSNFLTKTQDTYVSKQGQDEIDKDGNAVVGDLSGQFIYGGASANTHLTLYANSGDGVGPNTGFVQIGDQLRPLTTDVFDIGTVAKKFKDLHLSGNAYLKNISIVGDVLTSDTGAFNFGSNTIDTTGKITGGILQSNSFAELAQITTPANAQAGHDRLYFKNDDKLYKLDAAGIEKLVGLEFTSSNDNRLLRSDGATGEKIQESGITVTDSDEVSGVTSLSVDNILVDGSTISTTASDVSLQLTPNGTGTVIVPSLKLTTFLQDSLYVPSVAGDLVARNVKINSANEVTGVSKLYVDTLVLDANEITSTAAGTDLKITPLGGGRLVTKTIVPDLHDSKDLGAVGTRFRNLYLNGNLNDGTDDFPITELMKLREASLGAATGDTLFYNAATSKWEASHPDSEIDHGAIAGLADDDHIQYALLAGRSGGQTLIGSDAAAENLTLESTSNASKGLVLVSDHFAPVLDSGSDLGTALKRFKDIRMSGELKGGRLENFTTGTLPPSSAANIGRAVWNTTTKQIMVDDGVAWQSEGVNRFVGDISFDGIVLTKDVLVSSSVVDARNAIVQLLNNNNDFDRIYCTIKAISATTIRIETNTPLTAGSYRLIVIE